jgi:hypothetical protein
MNEIKKKKERKKKKKEKKERNILTWFWTISIVAPNKIYYITF